MKKILLIEDDAWLSEMYGDQLALENKVVSANSATQALDCLDDSIDLILLDMFLPDHNGIELIHEIASYSDTSKIPIVVLSAVHERDFQLPKNRWHQYGIIGYLYKPTTKPIDLLEFVSDYFYQPA